MDSLKNLKENVNFESCSPSVKKGIKWLENKLKKEKFSPYYATEFYILDRVNRPLVKKYLKAAEKKDFWGEEGIYEIPHEPLTLYYLSKLGLKNNKYFQECYRALTEDQRLTGKMGEMDQAHYLRTLIEIDEKSEHTAMAYEYYMKEEQWMDFIFVGVNFFDTILALMELDYYNIIRNYGEGIEKAIDFRIAQLKELFEEHGIIANTHLIPYVLQILPKMYGTEEKRVTSMVKMIKKLQNKDGSWGSDKEVKFATTSDILLGLLETAEGPKVPIQSFEFEFKRLIREYEYSRPKFLHTSPEFEDEVFIKEIEPQILRFVFFTDKILRISSPYLELFNEVLLKKYKKDKIELRILTRPPEGRSKKIINNLNKKTKGAVRFEPKLHSRVIIRDDIEMLVSSSDLNSDSLTNQFNAGIWTVDIDAVKKGIEYFDNIWERASVK